MKIIPVLFIALLLVISASAFRFKTDTNRPNPGRSRRSFLRDKGNKINLLQF